MKWMSTKSSVFMDQWCSFHIRDGFSLRCSTLHASSREETNGWEKGEFTFYLRSCAPQNVMRGTMFVQIFFRWDRREGWLWLQIALLIFAKVQQTCRNFDERYNKIMNSFSQQQLWLIVPTCSISCVHQLKSIGLPSHWRRGGWKSF